MVVSVAVVTPRPVAAALRALVKVLPVAYAECRNVGVAAQEFTAGLFPDRKALTRLLRDHSRLAEHHKFKNISAMLWNVSLGCVRGRGGESPSLARWRSPCAAR